MVLGHRWFYLDVSVPVFDHWSVIFLIWNVIKMNNYLKTKAGQKLSPEHTHLISI